MISQGDIGPAGKAGEPGDQGLRVSYECKSSSTMEKYVTSEVQVEKSLSEKFSKKLFSNSLFFKEKNPV